MATVADKARRTLPIASVVKTSYSDKEVYEPSDDSFALVDAFVQDLHELGPGDTRICVEVGSGSGYVITSAVLAIRHMKQKCSFTAIDISEAATRATATTLSNHGIRNEVDIVQGDLLSSLSPRLRKSVDLLLFNPPYVVTPDEELLRTGIAVAWAGGRDGRVVIDRMLDVLDEFLSPTGRIYMITIAHNKPDQLLELVHQRHGLRGQVVLTRWADEELIKVLRIGR
jgi:release factor glutamine methyltransferase